MKRYDAILSAFRGSIWAILPEKLEAIAAFLDNRIGGLAVDGVLVEKMAAENRGRKTAISRSVAVVPVVGMITQRADLLTDFSGGVSTERLGKDIEALVNDPEVGAIILDIDSPGGNYTGTPELAEKVYGLRGRKPLVAIANGMAASAAYWLATATDEVVVTPSGEVGSVGVLAIHYDMSAMNADLGITPTYVTYGRYKAEFNPDAPLAPEAAAELQRRVNEAGDTFVKALAKQRRTLQSNVRENYGQGRVFGAEEAVARGMADRIDTLEATISRLASGKAVGKGGRKTNLERERLYQAGLR